MYRYFTTTGDLLAATAVNAASAFLDRVVEHSSTMDSVVEMVTEGVTSPTTIDSAGLVVVHQ